MINEGNTMFEQILKQQGHALDVLMNAHPEGGSQLMKEAREDLSNAITKATQASASTSSNA